MSSAPDGEDLIPRGFHVHLDCVGYMPPVSDDHRWILDLMREAVRNSHAREVHAHVVPFDGSVSPPGFAAVSRYRHGQYRHRQLRHHSTPRFRGQSRTNQLGQI